MCYRGIYFTQMGPLSWLKLIYQNRRTIFSLVKEGFAAWHGRPARTGPDESLETGIPAAERRYISSSMNERATSRGPLGSRYTRGPAFNTASAPRSVERSVAWQN